MITNKINFFLAKSSCNLNFRLLNKAYLNFRYTNKKIDAFLFICINETIVLNPNLKDFFMHYITTKYIILLLSHETYYSALVMVNSWNMKVSCINT